MCYKICGSKLEEGSFSCPACGAYIRSRQDDASEIRKMKEVKKYEVAQQVLSHSPSKHLPITIHHNSQQPIFTDMYQDLKVIIDVHFGIEGMSMGSVECIYKTSTFHQVLVSCFCSDYEVNSVISARCLVLSSSINPEHSTSR